jgi:uncharacterized protein YceK
MKKVVLALLVFSFFGCSSTFKGASGQDGKPGEDGKPGTATHQKGEDGKDGEDGKSIAMI